MVRDMISNDVSNLTGMILVSTPMIPIKYLKKTMIYICKHDTEGTVGVIVNKPIPGMQAHSILKRLHIDTSNISNVNIHYGGAEEIDQCFMLHSDDFMLRGSVVINNHIALTINGDLIKSLSLRTGAIHKLICMGCCLWEPYQLEDEISANYWVPIHQDNALLFGSDKTMWESALLKIGGHTNVFAGSSGNA